MYSFLVVLVINVFSGTIAQIASMILHMINCYELESVVGRQYDVHKVSKCIMS